MGTGAVYVTLSGVKEHSKVLTNVETAFFFLNMFFFLLNSTTLALQAICTSFLISVGIISEIHIRNIVYPRQALRLIKDPVKGVFVPLIVRLH
jgi:hypothetical protein